MSNDENREKNEEKAAVPVQPIIDMGSTVVKNSRGTIHCLTIVGQVEGHTLLPDNLKSTKYEHVLPLLAALEQNMFLSSSKQGCLIKFPAKSILVCTPCFSI